MASSSPPGRPTLSLALPSKKAAKRGRQAARLTLPTLVASGKAPLHRPPGAKLAGQQRGGDVHLDAVAAGEHVDRRIAMLGHMWIARCDSAMTTTPRDATRREFVEDCLDDGGAGGASRFNEGVLHPRDVVKMSGLALVKVEHDLRSKSGAQREFVYQRGNSNVPRHLSSLHADLQSIRITASCALHRFVFLFFFFLPGGRPVFTLSTAATALANPPSGSRTNDASPARSNSLFLMATPRPIHRFFSAPISWCSAAGMVKLSRITLTSLTLFAAFLLLFADAPGFRFADLAGDAPICSASDLEGLLAIERGSKEGAEKQGEIIYYIYRLCKLAQSALRGASANTTKGGSDAD